MRTKIRLAVLAAAVALFADAAAAKSGDDNPGLPADQVIAAIRTAVAKTPGNVAEVEVEREHGRTVVEVKIRGADGARHELQVDVEKSEIVRTRSER